MTLHTPPPADAGGLSLARIEVDFVVAKKAQGAAPVEAADLAQAARPASPQAHGHRRVPPPSPGTAPAELFL